MDQIDEIDSDLIAALIKSDKWLERTSQRPSTPAPGSMLAGDDLKTSPYQLSRAAAWSLTNGVDHFHALRCLLLDGKTIHISAPFTLLRASIENTSTAVYLLAPAQQQERVFRRLNLQWAELLDAQSARSLVGASAIPMEERKKELRGLARDTGMSESKIQSVVGRPASTGSIVSFAGKQCFGPSGDAGRLAWMVNSGFAHGRTWAQVAINEKVAPRAGEDLTMARMTPSIKMISQFAQMTVCIIEKGWQLLDRGNSGSISGGE